MHLVFAAIPLDDALRLKSGGFGGRGEGGPYPIAKRRPYLCVDPVKWLARDVALGVKGGLPRFLVFLVPCLRCSSPFLPSFFPSFPSSLPSFLPCWPSLHLRQAFVDSEIFADPYETFLETTVPDPVRVDLVRVSLRA